MPGETKLLGRIQTRHVETREHTTACRAVDCLFGGVVGTLKTFMSTCEEGIDCSF